MIAVFGRDAFRDLRQIGDWIARDNSARALSFVRELRQACVSIATFPKAFPLVPEIDWIEIRRRNYGDYAILYRVEPERILIVAILHGARDLTKEISRRLP